MTKILFKQIALSFLCLAVMVISCLAFVGCGQSYISPWGKTFVASGYNSVLDDLIFPVDGKDYTVRQLVKTKKYYDKIDWEQTIGSIPSNADDALTKIEEKAKSMLDLEKLQSISFTFSDEASKKITFDGNEYDLTLTEVEGQVVEYSFKLGDNENAEKISIHYSAYDKLSYQTTGTTYPQSSLCVNIKFNSNISLSSSEANELSLSITYSYKVK